MQAAKHSIHRSKYYEIDCNPSILEHSGSAPIFINSGHNFVNCDDFKTGLLFQYSLNLLYFYSILLTYEWENKIFTYFFTLLKCSSETKMYSVLALTRFKAAFKVLVLSILLVLSVLYLLCLFLDQVASTMATELEQTFFSKIKNSKIQEENTWFGKFEKFKQILFQLFSRQHGNVRDQRGPFRGWRRTAVEPTTTSLPQHCNNNLN